MFSGTVFYLSKRQNDKFSVITSFSICFPVLPKFRQRMSTKKGYLKSIRSQNPAIYFGQKTNTGILGFDNPYNLSRISRFFQRVTDSTAAEKSWDSATLSCKSMGQQLCTSQRNREGYEVIQKISISIFFRSSQCTKGIG